MSKKNKVSISDAYSPWLDDIIQAPNILVGLSGGLDSSVLLHSLVNTIPSICVTAVHINHGLSKYAGSWQEHSRRFCENLGVKYIAESIIVTPDGHGLEQAAREARYRIFEDIIRDGDVLLLGHHMDDQIETFLYRVMRGSGPKGLGGMPSKRAVGKGQLIRPLLKILRTDLERYATENKITWVEDDTNDLDHFDRNYIRNRVIPILADRWPDYRARLTSTSELNAQSNSLTKSVAEQDLASLKIKDERAGWSLRLTTFNQLHSERQKNVLRYWAELKDLPVPKSKAIKEIIAAVINSRIDASPKVCVQNTQYRRYSDRLYLLDNTRMPNDHICRERPHTWRLSEIISFENSKLSAVPTKDEGLRASLTDTVNITFRQGGERCRPLGRSHSNSLKKCFQEFGLEPWWRNSVPLIFIDGELVAVADFWICEGWQAAVGESGLKIQWHYNSL